MTNSGVSGIRGTAGWIAQARAAETLRPDRLFSDDLAVAFTERSNAALLAQLRVEPTPRFDVLAVRTRFFDDFLLAATAEGPRQVVLMAAGLDARAFRLPWPADTRIYEVDLPELFDVKEDLAVGLPYTAGSVERVTVPADLTADWPQALAENGFDPTRPTVWLLEGILYYLTAEQVDAVLRGLDGLSTKDSAVGLEQVNLDTYRAPWMRDWLAGMHAEGRPWQSGVDDPESWLAAHGWPAVTVVEPAAVACAQGRRVPRTPTREVPGVARTWLVTAKR